jgi:hypothetical protein
MSEQTTQPVINNNKDQWRARDRGCYWVGENNRMTIHIKNNDGKIIKFIAFPNKFKEEGSNQPDGRIYIDIKDYKPSNGATTKTESQTKKVTKEPTTDKQTTPVVENKPVEQTETAPDF